MMSAPNHAVDLSQVAQWLAPSGCLRVAINLGNPILAGKDPKKADPHGISVDMAHELARRLQVPLEFVVVEKAMQSVQAITQGQADVGFFAIDPARSDGIGFTKPYVQIEGSYLVRSQSPITCNEEVDQAGHRIVVGQGSAYDLFLTRHIQHATLVRAASSQAVVAHFESHQLEVAAGVRQQLQADAHGRADLRLLPGRFMVIQQAMGLSSSRGVAAQMWLSAFVEELRSGGFVLQAMQRHRIQGATVVPDAD